MNDDQTALFDRAGELARRFHEARRRRLKEPGPDRPWFFHPLGYWIEVGYTGQTPEYDQPKSHIDTSTAHFARRMGTLSRITRIWEDKEAMVLFCYYRVGNSRTLLGNIYPRTSIMSLDGWRTMI
jgi:hypothetical protein